MRRPRISIAGMLILVACVGIALGVLAQPWEQAQVVLLTLSLLVLPFASIILRFGPRRLRLAALAFVRAVFRSIWFAVTSVLALLIAIAASIILYRAVFTPFDAAVLLMAVSTVMVLLWASYVAWFGRGNRRAFGWGFALLGWSYLLLSLAPLASRHVPDLLTTHALHAAYENSYVLAYPPAPPPYPTLNSGPRVYRRYQRVGHCLIGLLLATTGGLVARSLALRVEEPRDPEGRTETLPIGLLAQPGL